MAVYEGSSDLGLIQGDWSSTKFLARLAAELGPDMLVVTDPSGAIRFVGRSARRILGLDPARHPESHLLHFVHPDDATAVLSALAQVAEPAGYHEPVHLRIRNHVDEWVDCEVNMQSLEGPEGLWSILGIRGLADRDTVENRRDELQRLIHNASLQCTRSRWFEVNDVVEHLLRSLAGILGAQDVELAWSEHDDISGSPLLLGAHWAARPDDGWSAALLPSTGSVFEPLSADLFGSTSDARVFPDLSEIEDVRITKRHTETGLDSAVEVLLSPKGPRAFLRLAFADGSSRWSGMYTEAVGLLGVVIMSTLRRCAAEEQLNDRARRDSLTGLVNREELYRALNEYISFPHNAGKVGVLYGDIDEFKKMNDENGHAVGDELLRGVAAVMEDSIREGDVVARFGGDEFVAVCRGLEDPGKLGSIAHRIESGIDSMRVGGSQIQISLGCAVWSPELSADELIGLADAEMYRKKRAKNEHSYGK